MSRKNLILSLFVGSMILLLMLPGVLGQKVGEIKSDAKSLGHHYPIIYTGIIEPAIVGESNIAVKASSMLLDNGVLGAAWAIGINGNKLNFWRGSGSNLLVLDGFYNRVGIGTDSPASAFHVANGDIRVRNTFIGYSTTSNYGYLRANDGTERDVVLIPNGNANVGIGVQNPSAKLQVAGSAGTPAISTAGDLVTTGGLSVGYGSVAGAQIYGELNSYAGDVRVNSGQLAIGTQSPQDELDVDGDIRVRGTASIKDAGGTSRISIPDNGDLIVRDQDGQTAFTVKSGGVTDIAGRLITDSNGVTIDLSSEGYVPNIK